MKCSGKYNNIWSFCITSGDLYRILIGFGTAVGYTVAIVLLAAVREHLDEDAIPAPFRGAPIVLLCAALMAMAFVGFSGLA